MQLVDGHVLEGGSRRDAHLGHQLSRGLVDDLALHPAEALEVVPFPGGGKGADPRGTRGGRGENKLSDDLHRVATPTGS